MKHLVTVALAIGLVSGMARSESFERVSRSLTLEEAVAIAREKSPEIRAMVSSAASAEARAASARSLRSPRAAVTAVGTRGTIDNMFPGAPMVQPEMMTMMPARGATEVGVALSAPITTGGRNEAVIKREGARSRAETARLEMAVQEAAASAAIAYSRLAYAGDLVRAAEQRVADQTEQARVAQTLFDAGKAPKYYVTRAQAEVAGAQQDLATSTGERRKAEAGLAVALGYDPGSTFTVQPAPPPSDEASLETLREQALDRSPIIRAQSAETAAASAEVREARGAYRPQVYGTVRFDLRDAISKDVMGFKNGYTVGIVASLPLLDGGQRRADVRAAEAANSSSRSRESVARLQTLQAVEDSYADVQTARKNMALANASVTSAEENYDITKARFEAGKGIQVEVLDALSSLADARRARAERLYELNTASARLKQATASW